MKISSYGHSCLLVEVAGSRILFDPGVWCADFSSLRDLDAIVITHQHPDHVDPERVPPLVIANPQAALLTEAGVAEQLGADHGLDATPLRPGSPVQVGNASLEPVGEWHAVIHASLDRVHNTGVIVRAQAEPSLYHPGDAIDITPGALDVLCVPVRAPWSAMKEAIDWVAATDPRYLLPIHDAILSEQGRELYMRQIANLSRQEGAEQPREWIEVKGQGSVELTV